MQQRKKIVKIKIETIQSAGTRKEDLIVSSDDEGLRRKHARIAEERKAKLEECIRILTAQAGMSCLEARTAMIGYGYSGSDPESEFGVDFETFREARSSAEKKLEKSGRTLQEICGDSLPGIILY
jgi:hypothetical protein